MHELGHNVVYDVLTDFAVMVYTLVCHIHMVQNLAC